MVCSRLFAGINFDELLMTLQLFIPLWPERTKGRVQFLHQHRLVWSVLSKVVIVQKHKCHWLWCAKKQDHDWSPKVALTCPSTFLGYLSRLLGLWEFTVDAHMCWLWC